MPAEVVAAEIIKEILDGMFPAEKAASDFLSALLDNVDSSIVAKGKPVLFFVCMAHVVHCYFTFNFFCNVVVFIKPIQLYCKL